MNIGHAFNVRLSKPAEESLAYIIHESENIGQKIFGQLKHRLPYDPYPEINEENDIFHSELVKALKRKDFEVHRLKSKEFLDFRVFYIVDEEENLIYILEIVKRKSNTYNLDSRHMKTIMDLYIKYYLDKTNIK